jgi:hypothetical protein
MAGSTQINLEQLWAGILSENRAQVLKAWKKLKDSDAHAVIAQLNTIIADPERAEVQKQSALFALDTIQNTF